MNYIKSIDHVEISLDAIRNLHPDMAIPESAELSDIGYERILPSEPPALQAGEAAGYGAPQLLDGAWYTTWVVLPPAVPASVTRRQARQALLLAGLLDNVQPAIDAIADPVNRGMAQIEWDDSQAFERERPLVIQIGAALGLDDAGLDALFIHAAML